MVNYLSGDWYKLFRFKKLSEHKLEDSDVTFVINTRTILHVCIVRDYIVQYNTIQYNLFDEKG